ncbi:Homodimeric efflux ABC transporter, ATP-binding/permease protein [hydrothermal vent metagenome]|uniref:Homodimeric efflux ABC transporter, ATP-binding/permease protein n=1 Tax=hydrothermal vent metagenome TaxID=652676 RepID=A0A3B0TGH2_9ZZZZ
MAPAQGKNISLDQPRTERHRSGNLRPLAALLPFLSIYRARLALALAFLILAAGMTLAVPLAVRRIIDHGFTDANARFIDNYFATMIAIVSLLAIASSLRFYFVSWLGERVVADLRRAVFSRLLDLSPAFYDDARTGEVLSRLTADTTQIKSAVGSTASIALRNALLVIGSVAMMVVTSPAMSGLVLVALPVVVAPMILIGRWVRRLSRQAQDTLADTSAFAAEALGAMRVVQAFTQEERFAGRFGAAVETAFDSARQRLQARAWLTTLIIFLVFTSVVLILWGGAQDVLAGTMSAGELGQFVLYAIFAAAAVGALSEVWGEVQATAGATERLIELLEIEPEIAPPANPLALPETVRGNVVFEHVSFSYRSRPDFAALNEVDFTISPGERVALVGPSGSGKSTLFSLLLRFYDPTQGTISVEGLATTQLVPQDLRRAIAIVPQETVVFAATAADNIRFGRPDASDDEVRAAARAAQADGFIGALADGYATQLGERGVTLSGGQRQRIAIARAILKDAPILLLDEATSALDAESEVDVQQALNRLMEGRTSIVIAHRLATVLGADRILVMEDGRIIATGSHEALLAQGGLYARLARLQFASSDAVMARKPETRD